MYDYNIIIHQDLIRGKKLFKDLKSTSRHKMIPWYYSYPLIIIAHPLSPNNRSHLHMDVTGQVTFTSVFVLLGMQEVCFQYWPEVQHDENWEGHIVSTLEATQSPQYAKRLITITDPQVYIHTAIHPVV